VSKRGKAGTAQDLNLPPYMEARPMKQGGYAYRVQLDDGRKVSLGWNLQEALEHYQRLRGRFDAPDQIPSEIVRRHKRGAAQRGIEFEVTATDVAAMLQRQANRCAITQREFSNERPPGQRIRPWAASLDRKDSDKGYTVGNCRLVCASVNIAMNRFGDGAFVEHMEALVRRVVREEIAALLRGIPTGTPGIPTEAKTPN
jgi:hypothetical protein